MAYDEPADDAPKREPGAKKMDADEMQAAIHGILTEAREFIEDEVGPLRAKATEYAKGEKFGNEEEGRSQVVLREVADAVNGLLPSLMRVYFGSERVVEYAPDGPESVEVARQISDYINTVITEDNPGFLIILGAFKDALYRKLGIIKWGWDDTTATKSYCEYNMTQEGLEMLTSEPGVELTRVEDAAEGTFKVEFTRRDPDGRARVWSVPPDEFWFTREARDIDTALCIAHATEKTRGELIAMGISEDDIDEHGGIGALDDGEEAQARNPLGDSTQVPAAGEANDKHLYVEAYPFLDYDGDKIAELRKVCTLGPGYHVVHNEPVSERPFAVYCPDPEPHTLLGQSWADRTMDMQLLKSALMRGVLDSLSLSLFPRTAATEGAVNMADLQNTEMGSIVRVRPGNRVPDVLQSLSQPFIGADAFQIVQYVDEIVERRTGQNKGALGIDSDALQSSTKGAVGAAVTASQASIEMLARVAGEQLFKPLYRGLLRLLIAHQPRARMVRLGKQWVEMDPRMWNADMQVTVNVALGNGLVEEKIATLVGIAEKQEQVLATYGPVNPLVTVAQYRHTLVQILELQGRKDVDSYFQNVPADWQPPQQEPPPSPEMILAQAQMQIEQMKAQKDILVKEAELKLREREIALKEWEARQADDRERDKAAADIVMRRYEIDTKYGAQAQQADLDAQIERERMTTQAAGEHHGRTLQAAVDHHATETQAAVDAHAAETQAAVDRETAAQQAAQGPTE